MYDLDFGPRRLFVVVVLKERDKDRGKGVTEIDGNVAEGRVRVCGYRQLILVNVTESRVKTINNYK